MTTQSWLVLAGPLLSVLTAAALAGVLTTQSRRERRIDRRMSILSHLDIDGSERSLLAVELGPDMQRFVTVLHVRRTSGVYRFWIYARRGFFSLYLALLGFATYGQVTLARIYLDWDRAVAILRQYKQPITNQPDWLEWRQSNLLLGGILLALGVLIILLTQLVLKDIERRTRAELFNDTPDPKEEAREPSPAARIDGAEVASSTDAQTSV